MSEANTLPEGWRLIAVNAEFDNLMYWMDRCERKGHLENCSDLLEPWAAFQYIEHTPTPPRVLSELEGELTNALENLFALVMGECRQLLDEDSGGDSDLYMQITDVLEKTKGAA